MVGQVYLRRNANVTLYQTKTKLGLDVGFTIKFRPRARDIIPVSKKAKSKDVELAKHLKHVLQNNENGVMGEIEVIGEIHFYKKSVPRPNVNELLWFPTDNLYVNVKGSFPWLACKLGPEIADVRMKIQLTNLLVGSKNERMSTSEEMEQQSFCKDLFWHPDRDLFRRNYVSFELNPATWDNLFSTVKAKKKTLPKLTLVLCADLSAKMAQPLPIIGPTGRGYRLSFYLNELANKRKSEIKCGKETNAVIVAESGREFQIYEEYFSKGSLVFQAMLQNPGFEEGRTKRINLPDVEDKVVESLIDYLHDFNLKECMRDLGLAVKMLEAAERFQVDGLKASVDTILTRRFCNEFTVDQAIQLFIFTRCLEYFKRLNRKVFNILKCHHNKIKESQGFQELFKAEPEVAMELFTSAIESTWMFMN